MNVSTCWVFHSFFFSSCHQCNWFRNVPANNWVRFCPKLPPHLHHASTVALSCSSSRAYSLCLLPVLISRAAPASTFAWAVKVTTELQQKVYANQWRQCSPLLFPQPLFTHTLFTFTTDPSPPPCRLDVCPLGTTQNCLYLYPQLGTDDSFP